MRQIIHLKAQLEWRAEHGDTPDRWVAFCDALGINTEAASLDELHSVIPETIHLLFLELFEENEFEQFLSDRGWSATPEEIDGVDEDVAFDVPWHMNVPGSNDRAREAA